MRTTKTSCIRCSKEDNSVTWRSWRARRWNTEVEVGVCAVGITERDKHRQASTTRFGGQCLKTMLAGVLERCLRNTPSANVLVLLQAPCYPPLVARLDEQAHVCVHEGALHGHGGAVGQHELRVVAQLLDEREDVVPAPAVEACGEAARKVH